MYCHQCGEEIVDDSKFCSNCGVQVHSLPDGKNDTTINEIAISTEETVEIEHQQEQKKLVLIRILPLLIPLISLLVVATGLSIYYFQEKEVNQEVLQLKKSAEETALKEDYKQAKEIILQALSKRTDYSALKVDLDAIEKAIKYEEMIGQVSDNIKKSQFDVASKELANIKEKLSGEQDPLFKPFQKQVEDREINITVGSIKKELNNLTTIDQLGGKLSILDTLPENEASAVKQEILNKIVQISTDQVKSSLSNNQFSEAFSTIDLGLQYAVNNEKLLALKSRAEQDQEAFQQAEQQRIEKAMEAAAQEDLKNKTAAVDVSDISATVNQYGDLYVSGKVKNVATTNIRSITIYYSIYDENHTYLRNGYTSVYPYELQPGASGAFEDIYYGVQQNVNIEIDNITWYLN